MFTDEDLDIILDAAGADITVKQGGAAVESIRGIFKYEQVQASPFEAAAGVPVPFLTIRADKAALYVGKGNHTFTVNSVDFKPTGRPVPRADGLCKVQLTK